LVRLFRYWPGPAALVLVLTAAGPAPAQAPPASLPDARDLMARHVEAIGGREAVFAQSSTYAAGTMSMPDVGLSGKLELYAAKPNKVLMRTIMPGIGDFEEGFNGTVGWSVNPLTGPTLLQGVQLEQKKFDADFHAGLKPDERYESITTIELITFDGRPCYKVRLVRPGGGEDFFFYDAKTGLKAGTVGTREGPMGPITATSVETDYKRFGSLLHPTKITTSVGPQRIVMTFETLQFDKVDPAVFEPPAHIKALIK
jgi:hypothetical protein